MKCHHYKNGFQLGDYVRLKNGYTKMKITYIGDNYMCANYCHDMEEEIYEHHYDTERPFSQFVIWDPLDPQAKQDRNSDLTQEWLAANHHRNNIVNINKLNLVTETEDTEMTTADIKKNQLFQTIETGKKKIRYGTFLTKNSHGDIVLEMKGENGAVATFKNGDIEKVVPYTFRVKSFSNVNYICHYSCTKGDVSVGDILLSNSHNLYIVTSIDTCNEDPKATFVGYKLPTEKFGS